MTLHEELARLEAIVDAFTGMPTGHLMARDAVYATNFPTAISLLRAFAAENKAQRKVIEKLVGMLRNLLRWRVCKACERNCVGSPAGGMNLMYLLD